MSVRRGFHAPKRKKGARSRHGLGTRLRGTRKDVKRTREILFPIPIHLLDRVPSGWRIWASVRGLSAPWSYLSERASPNSNGDWKLQPLQPKMPQTQESHGPIDLERRVRRSSGMVCQKISYPKLAGNVGATLQLWFGELRLNRACPFRLRWVSLQPVCHPRLARDALPKHDLRSRAADDPPGNQIYLNQDPLRNPSSRSLFQMVMAHFVANLPTVSSFFSRTFSKKCTTK